MEQELERQQENNRAKQELELKQNQFINTTLGKVTNMALDMGIRWALPNVIEEQVIEVKNTILENGVKEGIKQAINNISNMGKSLTGILTGSFENVEQIHTAIKKGGTIDTISQTMDATLKLISKKNLLPPNITNLLKTGKNLIIDNIESNIEKELNSQKISLEKVNRYTTNWKKYYQEQNFLKMEQEYSKIKQELKNLIPIETVIRNARTIENIQERIKNNDENFSLSEEEIELAKKL